MKTIYEYVLKKDLKPQIKMANIVNYWSGKRNYRLAAIDSNEEIVIMIFQK